MNSVPGAWFRCCHGWRETDQVAWVGFRGLCAPFSGKRPCTKHLDTSWLHGLFFTWYELWGRLRSGNNEELWIGSEIFGAVEMEGWSGYFDLVIILGRPAQEIILPCQITDSYKCDFAMQMIMTLMNMLLSLLMMTMMRMMRMRMRMSKPTGGGTGKARWICAHSQPCLEIMAFWPKN